MITHDYMLLLSGAWETPTIRCSKSLPRSSTSSHYVVNHCGPMSPSGFEGRGVNVRVNISWPTPSHPWAHVDVVVSETIVLPVATLFMNMTFLQANLQSPALVLSEFWDLFSLSAPLPAANYYGYRARWYQSPRLAQIWFWNLPPTFLNCSTARICRWLEIQCRIPLPNPVVYTFWGPRIADEILWRHNFISSH